MAKEPAAQIEVAPEVAPEAAPESTVVEVAFEVAPEAKALRITALKASMLILPNGVEIAPGETKDLPAEYAANGGVLAWVEDGLAAITEAE